MLAVLLASRSRLAELALVDGTVGAVVAPGGRLLYALTFVGGGRIAGYGVIADPERCGGWTSRSSTGPAVCDVIGS